jgi:hypothetical protein
LMGPGGTRLGGPRTGGRGGSPEVYCLQRSQEAKGCSDGGGAVRAEVVVTEEEVEREK